MNPLKVWAMIVSAFGPPGAAERAYAKLLKGGGDGTQPRNPKGWPAIDIEWPFNMIDLVTTEDRHGRD